MPIIDNNYKVTDDTYAYAPSDSDYNSHLSNKDLSKLIDSLCEARSENSEAMLMDQVKSNSSFLDPLVQEEREIEEDMMDIEEDMLKSIFESGTELSIEERNELIANGLYQKYQAMIAARNNQEDDAMSDIEAELRAGLESSNNLEGGILDESAVTEPIFQPSADTSNEENVPVGTTEDNDTTEDTTVVAEPVTEATEDKPMTIEEINDVPATDLTVSDDKIVEKLKEQGIMYEDAMTLIDVMNRYKNKEKFKVFEALPESVKCAIMKEAKASGADKATIEFFSKSFINNLVNDIYLDTEIQSFNQELSKTLEPMGNIVGTMMDEYNDEVYENFTTKLLEKAEEVKESDPERAKQIIASSHNFEEAVSLKRILDKVKVNPAYINKNYKKARDDFGNITLEYNNTLYAKVHTKTCRPKSITDCGAGLQSMNIKSDYIATILSMIATEVIDSVWLETTEDLIYAYYLTNAVFNLKFTANSGKSHEITASAVNELVKAIDDYMAPLNERNAKRIKRRSRKKR